jgi:hypothetical protein
VSKSPVLATLYTSQPACHTQVLRTSKAVLRAQCSSLLQSHTVSVTSMCLTVSVSHVFSNSTLNSPASLTNSLFLKLRTHTEHAVQYSDVLTSLWNSLRSWLNYQCPAIYVNLSIYRRSIHFLALSRLLYISTAFLEGLPGMENLKYSCLQLMARRGEIIPEHFDGSKGGKERNRKESERGRKGYRT